MDATELAASVAEMADSLQQINCRFSPNYG
jgi:hypothetical protein